MEIKSITITGYKPYELNIFSEKDEKTLIIKEAIRRKLIPFLEEGLEWVVLSGQQGVETWSFEVLQSLKEEYNVKVAIIPPFVDQEKVWKEDKQQAYQQMIQQADFYQPLSNKTYEGPKQFFVKNKWIIEKTDGCILLYEEEFGGSPQYFYDLALKYQEKFPYELTVINSFDLDDLAREIQELNQSDF
ncbi:SLOG family protein [Aquisalibacillus elongatus]|uniref:Putative phage-like protein YoqJ n=1 Tax=Aquisalibacillus elongatus TaxID=485577 RepID=A0A3N5CAU0_9BACI|nr:SLOG family protein [Aquisalibacillus elongatus]RPF55805.1 putative phage-like protein YoqJ [Aquisalibacillus elongatus]